MGRCCLYRLYGPAVQHCLPHPLGLLDLWDRLRPWDLSHLRLDLLGPLGLSGQCYPLHLLDPLGQYFQIYLLDPLDR